MQIVGAGVFDARDLLGDPRKIRRQQRRREVIGHAVTPVTARSAGSAWRRAGPAAVDFGRFGAEARFADERVVDVHVEQRRADRRHGEVELLSGLGKRVVEIVLSGRVGQREANVELLAVLDVLASGTETRTCTWRMIYPDSFGPALTCSETGS